MEGSKEIKFQVPNINFNLSTPGAIILGACIIAGTILYTGSGANLRYLARLSNAPAIQDVGNQPSQAVKDNGAADSGQKANVTLGDLPYLGDANASVEVVEWGDFQCPFCKRFFDDVESKLITDYVNTGKIKFAFRDFAFLGQESSDAANAARCANAQGKFWNYHDYLYTNQGGENQGEFSKANLKQFAQTIGLNSAQFNACVDADTYQAQVEADKSAGDEAGVAGTPATFVNGKLISGAQPYSVFQQAINDALAGQ
ncbi:MAG: hypothetical protein A3A80_02785 [Candidatus Terrybacteria bacterium RIFCSPLOWO2_01_FULL_44_24]|uniref:Thioredoxin domain-containing protein n=1 Tax=Candidatus Terrybacteria bacterium RIFCSPHIGHO2_01_FULL_43_35 TaxID=1802361 RepID=A0A1G2PEM2_9BACT|nr:MAG: hypothetical protein A2828_02575 [Candidatus Terrybacteria bacterium RIFCSPHIGHO2_01_FULL_43_35]OHA50254.1 MAG: hypothetical protein A3B75_00425 [Candidatus Terrybacteria bacterium RIFCSPHIGHO2_02_FULL_43_14]OHA50995.1 MAG: hypothetical protein A3A80_02785 [Candidatus Terrybacteria bacterium RIFCSPLOWO2_01_FULL_44_24]